MKRINDHRNYFEITYIEGSDLSLLEKARNTTITDRYINIATGDLPEDITFNRITMDVAQQIAQHIFNNGNKDWPYIIVKGIRHIGPTKDAIATALKINLHNPYIIPIDSKQVTLGY